MPSPGTNEDARRHLHPATCEAETDATAANHAAWDEKCRAKQSAPQLSQQERRKRFDELVKK